MDDVILYWNAIALDVAKTDFSSSAPDVALAPQQPGPTRTSRALAIVHLAMFDAYEGLLGGQLYQTTLTLPTIGTTSSARVAVGRAASKALSILFSNQTDDLQKKYQDFLSAVVATPAEKMAGSEWGATVAQNLLQSRMNDGSNPPAMPHMPSDAPFHHRVDPFQPKQGFLDPHWGNVKPFGFTSLTGVGSLPAPLGLLNNQNQNQYQKDYDQVFELGADNSKRTPEQTTIGLFWAYDGARNIGVPPRLYNQVVRAIVEQKGGVPERENAKLFAAVNVAMADAGIVAWREKYIHNLWRPVVGIREAEAGWGSTGMAAQVGFTHGGDAYWKPLGAPKTNSAGLSAGTPSFPAYPSGHATFGTVVFRVVQKLLSIPENFTFSFVSDELNGDNVGATGIRPKHTRVFKAGTSSTLDTTKTYASAIDQAIDENIISRVYLGVHWLLDGEGGRNIGEELATGIATAFPSLAQPVVSAAE